MSYRYLCRFVFFLSLLGCRKFVEVPPPITTLVSSSVFKDGASATAAVTSIYTQMQAESFYMAQSCGLLSDELTNLSLNDISHIQYYTNSLQAKNNVGPWSTAYSYIYQSNAVMEGLESNDLVASAVKSQLLGEVKFLRAFWYFYLTNLYGDVPLILSTDYIKNASAARTLTKNVYEQIIEDLRNAQLLLNADYIDATDTIITGERARPNKWTATALLARAYLYSKKYDSAEAQSDAVISNLALYSLCSDLRKVFLKNSTEAIWQLATPLPTGFNTIDAEIFILNYNPIGSSYTPISSQLLNSFETGDLRKSNWIGIYSTIDNPSKQYFFPYKYRAFQTDIVTEYSMVLRLAEQYLIRAEARAELGINMEGAKSDIDSIRHRAGLPLYTGSLDRDSLISCIIHERQTELFTEWGHRWLDLKRTETVNFILGFPGNICQFKGGDWRPDWQLMPIPLKEINSDNNLAQNTGY